jgi:hypothetical protein
VFPADRRTFSVTFGVLPEDRDLRCLGKPAAFDAAARTIPTVAPLPAPGRSEAASDVAFMTGLRNQVRRLLVDRQPTVLGLVRAGDAAATSNPAHSRGCTLALANARAIAELVAGAGRDGRELAVAADRLVTDLLEPWVDDSIAQDAVRLARWRRGPAPAVPADRVSNGDAYTAAQADPVVRTAFTRVQQLRCRPDDVLADLEIIERVRAVLGRGYRVRSAPAPDHDHLVALAVAANAVRPAPEDLLAGLAG